MAAQASSSRLPHFHAPAAADDTHYVAKYNEMKRRVREIELENDRLLLKCLKARKNIGRLRLERAILYERLATMPTAEQAPYAGDPGTHQRPHPLDAQEYYQQPQARFHPDKERAVFQQPPAASPPMPYPKMIHHEPPAAKSRLRKPAQDAASPPLPGSLPPLPTIFQETWKAGPRTYPFVHEYQQQQKPDQPAAESSHVPPAYPSEIRFHQYDTSERPAHRSRRDFDRDADKSTPSYKARPGHDRIDSQSQSHSPGPLSSSSSQGGPAYPPLRVEVRPQRAPESDREPRRDSHAPRNGPGPHPEDWRHSNGLVPRKYHEQHDHRHPPEDPARHLPSIQKRSFAQFDQEHHALDGDQTREDRKRSYKGRGVEDDPHLTLPRVRAGDIVD